MNALVAGARVARERLRGAAPLAAYLATAALVFALATLDVRSNPYAAADRALEGPVFGFALPLLAYAALERATAHQRLAAAVDVVARYGSNRRAAALGFVAVTAVASALGGCMLAVLAVLIAHPAAASGLWQELAAGAWIGALAGSVYALWFAAASCFGARGGGRTWALLLDFLLGTGSSALAAPWPRGHVRNLLGGLPVLDLSQRAAFGVLLALGLVCVAGSLGRLRA